MGSIASKVDPRIQVSVAASREELKLAEQCHHRRPSSSVDLKSRDRLNEGGLSEDSKTSQKSNTGRRGTKPKPSANIVPREKRQPLSFIKKSSINSNSNRRPSKQRRNKMSSGYTNKENINNFATQAPSSADGKQLLHSTAQQHSTSQRIQNKLRPVKKGTKTSDETYDRPAERANVESTERKKVPVDPPGHFGAMPLMPDAYNMYQGNPPSFASWAFQPAPKVGPSVHGWGMPPFLAPLADAVRHPFANFAAHHHNGAQYYGQPHPQPPTQHYESMEEEDADSFGPISENATAELNDDDDDMSDSDSVDLPSTFAPDYVVERIRSRRLIESLVEPKSPPDAKTVTQNRAITRSVAKAMKKNATEAAAVAHQAASPVSKAEAGIEYDADSTEPEVMTVLGKKVTMIDPVRKVFIIDLLSPEQCDHIRMMADNHTRRVYEESGPSAPVWRTLYTYTKMDLPVCEIPKMREKYTESILLNVKRIVGEIFGKKKEALALRPRSWKEPHMLLYQAVDGKPHHTGIEMHYDGCDITWQAMLTRNDEYEGGGTYFRCLRKTILLRQGQVLVHPGELYHKGLDITYGIRCLLVCFTDGFSPKILDDSKAENDNIEYEKNTVLYGGD
ncbi:hypothetical protein ACHAXN_007385 [Cyclotella atomus]